MLSLIKQQYILYYKNNDIYFDGAVSILDNKINESGEVETKKTEYKAIKNNGTFTFRGRGWGHAVGMSQNGAKGMAENGFTCEEIIKWYYRGVEIEY